MLLRFRPVLGVLCTALLLAPGARGGPSAVEPRTPWFDSLGRHSRPITTDDAGAQGYFDQGLAFLIGGNPDEARRSFEEAARFDPRCAMAYWGLAMAHGPQLELPPPTPAGELAAVAALNRAHELAQASASPVERDLIAALAQRHLDPPPADRRELDRAFARAMREVHQRYPQDPDVGAWSAAAGLLAAVPPDGPGDEVSAEARAAVLATLDRVLQLDAKHPLAHRLRILVLAESPRPEQAEASAALLPTLAPGLGHFVALPARIHRRLGRWEEALAASEAALAADDRYLELAKEPPERYRVTRALHRLEAVHAAAMTGRSARAIEEARLLVAELPPAWRTAHPRAADPLLAVPLQVLVRFGRWDDSLAETEMPNEFPLARVWWHAGRGLARAVRQDLPGAREELAGLAAVAGSLRPDTDAWARSTARAATIAADLLAAEILHRSGEAGAVTALRHALDSAEQLAGIHRQLWLLPVRHALGQALLADREWDEARIVFEQDLAEWPGNGWALLGLAQVLHAQERLAEAREAEARFAVAWRNADLVIDRAWLAGPADRSVALAQADPAGAE